MLFQPVSERALARAGEAWYGSRDPKGKVGSKHHIVPQAILRRFANSNGSIRVRDRFTGKSRVSSISDLAVRDFYTFLDDANELNSVMEDWLAAIESEFARVVRPYLDWSTFRRDRPLTPSERFAVDTFTAVQMLRGMRTRRSMELLAEYYVKLTTEYALTPEELAEIQVVPHQNEHIAFLQRASESIADTLGQRPLVIARFNAPLLAIGDEPVVLTPRDGAPKGDTRKRVLIRGERIAPENIVQVSSGSDVGLDHADEVIFPVSPSHALVYFAPDLPAPATAFAWQVPVRDVAHVSREINRLQARNAMNWVAASDAGPRLAEIPWPKPSRPVVIYDDHTAAAELVNARPHARPQRLRK